MKNREEEPPTIIGPSFVFNSDKVIMIEQIYDPANEFIGFAVWDGNKVEITDCYEHDGVVYSPRLDDGIKKRAIMFPSKAENFNTVAELIEEIKQFCRRWLDIKSDFLELAVWYILLTWVHDRVNTIAYLRAMGDWGTGKSRFLDTIGGLCYRPMNASGATTAAAVARLIELWGGTLILNEADWEKSDERQEIVRILNEGFERRRAIIKAHQDKQKELIYYSVFGPKIIATRKQFDDPALESRCLTEVMEETTREDILPILTEQFAQEQQQLRNKLLMFRFKFRNTVREEAVHDIFPKLIEKKIERRLIQATVTFSVLFADNPELFARFINFLERYQRELREERATSYDGMIVNAIFKLGVGGDNEIYAQKIADQLTGLGWMGDPPSPRTIGKHLRTLKIKTKNKRVSGADDKYKVVKAIIWDDEQVKRAVRLIRKYVPDADDCSVVAFVANVAKGIATEDTHTKETLDTYTEDHIPFATNATNATTLQKPSTPNATNATTSDLKSRLFSVFGVLPFKPSQLLNHFQGDDLVRVNNLLAGEMLERGEVMKVVMEGGAWAWQLVRKG